MAVEVTEIETPLYQRVGEKLYLLNIQTVAKQVKMLSETSQPSTVQTEIEELRKKIAGLLAANDAMVFKGVIEDEGGMASADYSAGWTYKVGVAGTYKGQQCEVGDLIICVKDYAAEGADTDWTVVQTNIDGAVTGPESATDGNLAAFDKATGKIIKDSTIGTADVQDAISKKHEHKNKEDVLDKLTVGEDGLLKLDGKGINDGLVEVVSAESIETIPDNLRDGGLLIVSPALE